METEGTVIPTVEDARAEALLPSPGGEVGFVVDAADVPGVSRLPLDPFAL